MLTEPRHFSNEETIGLLYTFHIYMIFTKQRGALMLDDFIIRAILAGTAVSLAAGPLGSFIVWKKMSFFGDALAHSAILGVVIGIIMSINQSVSIAAFAIIFSAIITLMQRQKFFSGDTILGMAAHGSLAIGMIALGIFAPSQFNLINLLFGDILATSYKDILVMYSGAAAIIGTICYIWQPLLLSTVNEDLARVEGINVNRISLIFTLLVSFMVALSIKIVGITLVSSLLIIPAATARIFANTPEKMAMLAGITGTSAVVAGILISLKADTQTGPTIVVTLLVFFVTCWKVSAKIKGHVNLR